MSASGIETRVVKLNDVDKDGGYTGLPDDNFVQLIAENGVFLFKNTPFYTATVPLNKVTDPSIGKLSPICRWKTPSLPLVLLCEIESFFGQVYEKHKSEAIVLLYVCLDKKVWAAKVPEQSVSGAHADYDLKKMPQAYTEGNNRYYLFGSIHSHGSMSAFHSGTDDSDELHFDGLHITIGDIPKVERSYAVRYMIHGTSFGPLKLRDVVDFPDYPSVVAPEEWMKQVSEKKYGYISHVSGGPHVFGPHDHEAEWYRSWREGKDQPGGNSSGTTGTKSDLSDDRRAPPSGKANKKGKLRWKARASFDHCYTCLNYKDGAKCSERGKTLPFATCSRFDPNPDVSERILEEAHCWATLMEDKKTEQITVQQAIPEKEEEEGKDGKDETKLMLEAVVLPTSVKEVGGG